MSIWSTAPLESEPEIVLRDWTVFEVSSEFTPKKTRHFVGYSIYGQEGRVSSPIVRFDAENMIGMTKTGRVYRLEDSQGTGSLDGLYTFDRWCQRNDITSAEVVDIEEW